MNKHATTEELMEVMLPMQYALRLYIADASQGNSQSKVDGWELKVVSGRSESAVTCLELHF
jgi:hypothetical protein